MILMFGNVIQINKNFVKIYYYTNIEKVRKYIVYKLLESFKRISETKRCNCPFK